MTDAGFQPDWFSKPGDTIAAIMAERHLTRRSLAELLGTDVTTVTRVLAGSVSINSELADRLSLAVGGSSSFWTKRQAAYENALGRAVSVVPQEASSSWLRKIPLKDMEAYGWTGGHVTRDASLRTCLAYFGVSGPQEWEERYAGLLRDVAFRTSPAFESKVGALSAWLRQAELEAALVSTMAWNRDRLRALIPDLRKLTKLKGPAAFVPKLRALCASAGVAVVFVRAPSGCRASGATHFLSPRKAMIVLSFRYLSNDHFWFTFFHELAHLTLHGSTATFVDGEVTAESERESEANAFAAGVLIPLERRDELLGLKARTEAVLHFAKSVSVAPGIVVGQLQHYEVIGRHQLNFLKRRYRWEEIGELAA